MLSVGRKPTSTTMTTEEVAEFLGFAVVTIRRMSNRGDLRVVRHGAGYRKSNEYDRAEIEDFKRSYKPVRRSPLHSVRDPAGPPSRESDPRGANEASLAALPTEETLQLLRRYRAEFPPDEIIEMAARSGLRVRLELPGELLLITVRRLREEQRARLAAGPAGPEPIADADETDD